MKKTVAIIVAGGRGTRAGPGGPKQWRGLAGRRVVDWTLDRFATHPGIDGIVLVIHAEDAAEAGGLPSGVTVTTGGATRAQSVRAGLDAAAQMGAARVLIHDAARATVPVDVIDGVCSTLAAGAKAAAPGLSVTDALWTVADGRATGTRDRDGLMRAQTPQGFDLPAIMKAHAAYSGAPADDVAVALAAGLEVVVTPGHDQNIKITQPEDFARAEAILRAQGAVEAQMDIRLGNGYDVHRFKAGDSVTLCGVAVPHSRALEGHSDADVGMHAVTDAIYGALAEGDIGRHFPPSDPKWKGAASDIFLRHACDLARARGFALSNIDCTLVCERPKIGPHAGAMQAAMAQIMGLEPDRVSIKATTSERLGFTGREEGIAAIATATLVKA